MEDLDHLRLAPDSEAGRKNFSFLVFQRLHFFLSFFWLFMRFGTMGRPSKHEERDQELAAIPSQPGEQGDAVFGQADEGGPNYRQVSIQGKCISAEVVLT